MLATRFLTTGEMYALPAHTLDRGPDSVRRIDCPAVWPARGGQNLSRLRSGPQRGHRRELARPPGPCRPHRLRPGRGHRRTQTPAPGMGWHHRPIRDAYWFPHAVNLRYPRETEAFLGHLRTIPTPSLLVIDTLARCSGGDENSWRKWAGSSPIWTGSVNRPTPPCSSLHHSTKADQPGTGQLGPAGQRGYGPLTDPGGARHRPAGLHQTAGCRAGPSPLSLNWCARIVGR